tara:strand:- start:815 stop:1450 length:636 start_codon:yes stop_codon:yes gene_type:complete
VIYEDRYPDDFNPGRTANSQGYSMGKIIAENAFGEVAEISGRWDAVTCCSSDNVGPIVSKHQKNFGPRQHQIEGMLLGKYDQNWVYRPWFPVDVRGDANCHIGLLESTEVDNGDRFIAGPTDAMDVADVCAKIDKVLPELSFEVSESVEIHPKKIQVREEKYRSIWMGFDCRNERIQAVTGVAFKPFEDSLRDWGESLVLIGGVKPLSIKE